MKDLSKAGAGTTAPAAGRSLKQYRRLLGSAVRIMAASLAGCLLAPANASAADQTVTDFEAAQQASWNAHDAAAYTAAFDKNADIVTSLGWHWTGQAQAETNLGDGFKLVYA